MDELDLKAKFLEFVGDASPPRKKPVVTTEFPIMGGNTRADLAILGDEFVGVEIKSRKDSLSRLSKQVADYRAVFDRVVLVLDGKHLVQYLSIDFHFCDVWTINFDGQFRIFSQGEHHRSEPDVLFSLLTAAEREQAYRSERFQKSDKREIFEYFFRQRYARTSSEFWRKTRNRKIKRTDLEMLSRFSETRKEAAKLEAEKDERIRRWIEVQSSNEL